MPNFENESRTKLRWYIENFPSPHPFFQPAMAALEKKEAEDDLRSSTNQSAIHIHNSNVANLNLGSQVATNTAQTIGQDVDRRLVDRRLVDRIVEFKEQLRQTVRSADLEWSLLNKPEKRITPQMICKQVDEFRAALAKLYSRCPTALDSEPLRDAIEKLDATREHRLGNNIGGKREADQVCEKMETALTAVRAMVPNPT
jgi:hypothetical protein